MSNDRTDADLAKLFKALSNPHRLAMFVRLANCCTDGQPCRDSSSKCVGDLGGDLGVCASTISHHIKELANAGIIRCERDGQTVRCTADPDAVRALKQFFGDLIKE